MIVRGLSDSTCSVETSCPICGKDHVTLLPVPADAIFAWELSGRMVQDALPTLSPGQRETLISGSHEKCFDELYKEDE